MGKKILVTGATGSIGSLVVPKLAQLGGEVRVLVRDAAKAKSKGLDAAGAEICVGDFDKPETVTAAMKGVDTVVLVTAAGPTAVKQATAAIDCAKAAGVRKIVRISVVMPDERRPTDNVRQHSEADAKLQASGLAFTILRPHFFMQNLFMSAGTIGQEGKMYWGMGDGKMSMIDVRDIADVAAKVAIDDEHDNAIYQLTGPATLTFREAAKEISDALGKAVDYVPIPPEAVEDSLRKMGMGDWFAEVMRDYSKAYASGWGDFLSGDVEKVLGRKPRSFREFVREVLAPALRR